MMRADRPAGIGPQDQFWPEELEVGLDSTGNEKMPGVDKQSPKADIASAVAGTGSQDKQPQDITKQ